jgi:SAM-dependent methyltransferase
MVGIDQIQVRCDMGSGFFVCPVCKGQLSSTKAGYHCVACIRDFPIVDDIPDFFTTESEHDFDSDPNIAWLEPRVVEARDTIYRLCTRELKGMAFCMREIGRRTHSGCRVLEVGMGTGHFTRWLAEVCAPGTEIYAFDFSWPIIEKAKANIGDAISAPTGDTPELTLFRANAREELPFIREAFDVLLARLVPLGPRGVPNVQAAFELLKPGGWYFWAGWEAERYETPRTEWAIQHGFDSAEFHVWQYRRVHSEEEIAARQTEYAHLSAMFEAKTPMGEEERAEVDAKRRSVNERIRSGMTHENVLIAQKPPTKPVLSEAA